MLKNDKSEFAYYENSNKKYDILSNKLNALSHEYIKNFDLKIDLKADIKEQISQNYLTEEMKKILDYSELQLNLNNKENKVIKKMKI